MAGELAGDALIRIARAVNSPHSVDTLITVGMVTYNSGRYIRQAIEYVLAQSHSRLELLIFDDNSKDDTWAIISEYKDPRIKPVRNATNVGEYRNRNQVIAAAAGRYLIFVDGDDILYPHGLEFMGRMLDAFPDSAMAIARPWSEQIVYPYEVSPGEIYRMEFLGKGTLAINFMHVMFRTDVLRAVGGFDLRYRCGDEWIQLRISREHKGVLVNQACGWWRRTPNQASEAVLRENVSWAQGVMYRSEFLAKEGCPLEEEERQLAFENIYGEFVRLLIRYIARGKWSHALKLWRISSAPVSAWKHVLTPGRREHLATVTAAAPLCMGWQRHPYARTFPATTARQASSQ